MDVMRDLPYDYATLLENVMDVSHVPFTHHLTVGNRKNAAPVDLELGQEGVQPNGFTGLWQEARAHLACCVCVCVCVLWFSWESGVRSAAAMRWCQADAVDGNPLAREQGPRRGALGSQFTTFTAPTLMVHRLTSKAFGACFSPPRLPLTCAPYLMLWFLPPARGLKLCA